MLTRNKLIGFIILAVAAFLVALIIVYFVLFGSGGDDNPTTTPGSRTTTLEIWGLFDDSDVFEPMISAYKKTHPTVNLIYRKYIWEDYESTLVNRIAAGQGPDIFIIHNSWMGKHQDKLASAPKNTRNPFVSTAFNQTHEIFAFPLFIDNLALFYNKDLFAKAGFTDPPKNWEQFLEYSQALTKFSSSGAILQSGAAMGTNSRRINRATDILTLLFLQNGVPLFTKEGNVGWEDNDKLFDQAKNALRFYTDFANPSKKSYAWNEDQHYSMDAFIEGQSAMMFNYAYNIDTLRKKDPYLNFGTAAISIKTRPITVGNYWGLAVSKRSPSVAAAWDFLTFFSSDEQYKTYIQATKRLPAKDELLRSFAQDPLLKAFVDQVPFMVSPYQPDEKKIQDILDEMIVTVNKGERTLDQALTRARERLSQLIK